ncbi:MAG: Histidine triad domain protein [Parcubacteria group bacterium]|nr:Histidine triad domain protein [Parcubacteria group bacterium]
MVMPRGGYTAVLDAIIAGGFCPFCEEHLFKHHKNPVEEITDLWIVTRNAWPYPGSTHHFLFIPREHVETVESLTDEQWLGFHRLYRTLVNRYSFVGATHFFRSGKTAITGASVNHLHAHLVVGGMRTENSAPIKAIIGFSA